MNIEIGRAKILVHTIAEPLAFFIGFRYYLYLRKKQGDVIEDSNRIWILIAAIFGALIGSRIVGGLEDPEKMLHAKNIGLHFYLNKTVLGGLLGGLFAVEFAKKLLHETKASGDLFTYPLILAIIIGRVGCFSMGIYEDTYGTPTSLPLGMNLGDNLRTHPVALYEIFFLILLWVILSLISKTLANGARFKIFLMSYFLFRFLLEFIKPHHALVLSFSSIQVACIIGFVWYLPFILAPKKLFKN